MKIMAFGIHPDDTELGCGATIAKCAAQGHEVTLVDLTRGENSSNGTPEERAREAAQAAKILGCRRRENLGIPDAGVQAENPEFQRRVVDAIRQFCPDVVLFPLADDPHPDHQSGGVLVERAIYFSAVDGYKTGGTSRRGCAGPWAVKQGLIYPGRRDLDPDVIVDVTGTFQTKMDAVRAHQTQFVRGNSAKATPLNQPDFLSTVEARARWAGSLIGVRYGEPFMTLKAVKLEDLSVFA